MLIKKSECPEAVHRVTEQNTRTRNKYLHYAKNINVATGIKYGIFWVERNPQFILYDIHKDGQCGRKIDTLYGYNQNIGHMFFPIIFL